VTTFRPHPAQLRALEAIESGRPLLLMGGRNVGRRYATEQAIIAFASSPEQAALCLEDLERHGVALQDKDGNRVDPKPKAPARFRYCRFDEERRR